MDQVFDPYRKWLGIPASDQPAHHYRLLGIELFETDPDVISNAADGRMAQVKSFQTGKYAADSQRILNQIAAAKICLLDPQKKCEYDLQLQQRLASTTGAEAGNSAAEGDLGMFDFAAAVSSTRGTSLPASKLKTSKAKKQPWPIYAAAGGLVVAGVAALFAVLHAGPPADDSRQSARADSPSKPEAKPAARPESSPPAKMEAKVDVAPAKTGPAKPAVTADEPKPETPKEPKHPPEEPPKLPGPDKIASNPESKPDIPKETTPEPQPAKPKLAAVPDKPSQQAAEAKVREIFQKEFAGAKTGKSHAELAKKLVEQADGTKDDAAAHYVLLKMAGQQAVLGGDVALAMEIVDKMQADYEIDAGGMKADVLTTLVRQSGAEKAVFDTAMKLCDEAAARDDFELADRFANSALAAGRKSRDTDQNHLILARMKEIERLKGRFVAVQKALDTLASDASDGGANLIAGQWYCLTKGDWDKGLPMLAKGNRGDLADLAKRDLAKPAAAKEQTALGDDWWTLGGKEAPAAKQGFETRARHWYEESLPQLTGLDKARVEKRLEQAAAPQETPAKIKGRGKVVAGNVALSSNGTKVLGTVFRPEAMLSGTTSADVYTQAPWPCEWTIELDKVYELRQIRFLLGHGDNRFYRYALSVSANGQKFTMVADHSRDKARDWQDITFSPRPVKQIKLIGLFNSANADFHVHAFEAYCIPPDRKQ